MEKPHIRLKVTAKTKEVPPFSNHGTPDGVLIKGYYRWQRDDKLHMLITPDGSQYIVDPDTIKFVNKKTTDNEQDSKL